MRKTFALLVNILWVLNFSNAQENSTRKETFENNKFNWEEFAEKKKSVSIEDGYLVLQCKKEEMVVETMTKFPLRINDNFKIIFKFLIPELNDENRFGIIFNGKDANNYSAFLVKEAQFELINKEDGDPYKEDKDKIILKKGKNKEVVIELEKLGKKVIFYVNGIQVKEYEPNTPLKYKYFGIYSENKATIKVDEITIRQVSEEE